jgi:hypothetical protein
MIIIEKNQKNPTGSREELWTRCGLAYGSFWTGSLPSRPAWRSLAAEDSQR